MKVFFGGEIFTWKIGVLRMRTVIVFSVVCYCDLCSSSMVQVVLLKVIFLLLRVEVLVSVSELYF